jgi:hypothetical protein
MTPTVPAAGAEDNFLRPMWATDYAQKPSNAVWGGLFVDGAFWSFWVQTQDAGGVWSEPVKATCRVTRYELSEHHQVTTVQIACAGPLQSSPIAGVWSQSAAGVSWMSTFMSNAPLLHMPAVPVAGVFSLGLGTGGPSDYKIERAGDAWCRSDSIDSYEGFSYRSLCVSSEGPDRGEFLDSRDRPTRFRIDR